MDELVLAVEALSKKSIADYLLIIVPIVVSLIAIIVSVRTARKQNKIMLFEKRYEVLSQIRTMLSFSSSISGLEDMTLVFCFFDGYFGTNLYNKSLDERIIQSLARIEVLKDSILQAKFLFGEYCNADLEEIVEYLKKYILALLCDQEYIGYREKFCSLCTEFYNTNFKELVRITKIE